MLFLGLDIHIAELVLGPSRVRQITNNFDMLSPLMELIDSETLVNHGGQREAEEVAVACDAPVADVLDDLLAGVELPLGLVIKVGLEIEVVSRFDEVLSFILLAFR